MRQSIMIIVAGFFLLAAMGCSSQSIPAGKVPSLVLNSVKGKYPDASKVDWEKTKSMYEAEVQLTDSTEVTLQLDGNGKILMQKSDLAHNMLPAAVLTALQTRYKEYTIDDVELLEKDGVSYYQVELEAKGKKDLNLVLGADGTEQKIGYWD